MHAKCTCFLLPLPLLLIQDAPPATDRVAVAAPVQDKAKTDDSKQVNTDALAKTDALVETDDKDQA